MILSRQVRFRFGVFLVYVSLLLFLPHAISAADRTYVWRDDSPLYTEFLDRAFPFLEATIDLRGIVPAGNADNLVPRALVIPLGHDVFVCFDTELLRVAAIWQGDFITPQGIAILSYPVPLRKMDGGQESLPKPVGNIIAGTGLYPGWFRHGEARFEDPRPRWVDPNELGRGPLPPEYGQWLGAEDAGASVILRYTLFAGSVREHFRIEENDGRPVVVRSIEIAGTAGAVDLVKDASGEAPELLTIHPSEKPARLAVVYPIDGTADAAITPPAPFDFDHVPAKPRHWPESTTTSFEPGRPQGSYAVDHLTLPYPNPWERRIRPSGIDFFPDGDAVLLTFDGDVYRLEGLGRDDDRVKWTRVAAGFHEPQGIRIRDGEIFVFSRMGITRLVDRDGDGETDFYHMFCNRFTQSGDTRDFPLSLVVQNDGSFLISKGGQQETALSPHSGRVLHISPDGKEVRLWAYGMRNGYLNSIPERGLITASDQQGNWVPSTPFLIVDEGDFLGYEPGGAPTPREPRPAPLWIPHRISQSGTDPVWAGDPRLGALNGSVLFLDYVKPAVIKIFIPETDPIVQTAGVPLDVEFEVPFLKGAINPADGMPYLVGFQVWSCLAPRLEGISRLRVLKPTDELPTRAVAFAEGVLLSFSTPLPPDDARDPANYMASTWDYRRTEKYGSAQYKADGTPGVDKRFVHTVLQSEDGRSIFLAIDQMAPVMQLEVQHKLSGKWTPVYFTLNELPRFPPEQHGFAPVDFPALFSSEPTPRDMAEQKAVISVARGQDLVTVYGCVACHSIDGTTEGKTGPTWRGLYRKYRHLVDGTTVRAEDEYLRLAILEPTRHVVEGYANAEGGMPSYQGILSPEDVESLVLYIRSLQ